MLAIGLAISAIFQLLVLRNPARRTLRKAVAHVTMLNSSYMLILQAYVRASASDLYDDALTPADVPRAKAIPADPEHRASQAAIQRVEAELRKREVEIQESIIAVMPLLKCVLTPSSPVEERTEFYVCFQILCCGAELEWEV